MEKLDSFLVFESKRKYNLDDILSCFVELEDEGFNITAQVGYLKFNRNISDIKEGVVVGISHSDIFLVDHIIEILEVAQEYIEERYDVKLDFITKVIPTYHTGDVTKVTSFDEIGECFVDKLIIHFRPNNTIDRVKKYIKTKLK